MDKTCVNLQCVDPCPGSCGVNTECTVVAHNPVCTCSDGYTGDPFSHCFEKGKKYSLLYKFLVYTYEELFLYCSMLFVWLTLLFLKLFQK